VQNLRSLVEGARAKGVEPRSLSVINPGNPTGQLLTYDDIAEIVDFCTEEGILILADEVYQENVYEDGAEFVSFKKVVADRQSSVELVSFHSVSKGLQGECGLRGGYMELVNLEPVRRPLRPFWRPF
jgi:alanine transaminase